MIAIEVALTNAAGPASLLDAIGEAIRAAVPQQLLVIQATWIEAVSGRTLPGMVKPIHDDEYAQSVADPSSLDYPFNADPFWGRVVTTETARAQRHEQGYASFDIKVGLLAGPTAKHGVHGRYATVPFTHATPGTAGQKGAAMPAPIYEQAEALAHGQRLKLQGELAQYGRRSKNPFVVNLEARARGVPGPMAGPYTWRASPYQGMVRGGQAGHTTYRTFRRVSDQWTDPRGRLHGSDPASWIHPGQPANPVVASVAAYLQPQITAAIQAAIQGAVGG